MSSDDEDFAFYGTPLDPIEEGIVNVVIYFNCIVNDGCLLTHLNRC